MIKQLFLKQKRFDLMFKYLFAKNFEAYSDKTDFFKEMYLEHVRVFNNFYEREPAKITSSEFLKSFKNLYDNIKTNGFDNKNPIPVSKDGQIINGAHRLSICTATDTDAEFEIVNTNSAKRNWDYSYFRKKHINSWYADYVALEYIKMNPNAYVVNLQPIVSPGDDYKVEKILNKYGFIYYKKNIFISRNGLINLKKLFYGKEKWIGSLKNDFKGAKGHAKASEGPYPLRAFVFVCDDINKVRLAKEEIRNVYKLGKSSVHINDSHQEAIDIAECYFNDNSLFLLNNRPYNFEDELFDSMLTELPEGICCAGSTSMNVFGLRKSKDIDFLALELTGLKNEHTGIWEEFYPYNKYDIILNPENYFYYKGKKFITLDIVKQMKQNRNEEKDKKDVMLIEEFLNEAVDYSEISNTNFEIYQDVLQKLISAVRAEVMYRTSIKRRLLNFFFPNRSKYKLIKYKIMYKITSGKRKERYRKKIQEFVAV